MIPQASALVSNPPSKARKDILAIRKGKKTRKLLRAHSLLSIRPLTSVMKLIKIKNNFLLEIYESLTTAICKTSLTGQEHMTEPSKILDQGLRGQIYNSNSLPNACYFCTIKASAPTLRLKHTGVTRVSNSSRTKYGS